MGSATPLIGQLDDNLGLLFFSGIDEFVEYLEAAAASVDGEAPIGVPPHFALNFQRGADLSAALRKGISQHRWEVAAASAHPWLTVVDGDLVARTTTAKELAIAEAIALALSKLLADKKAVHAACSGGEPLSRTLSVVSHAGALEVILRLPYRAGSDEYLPPYDVVAGLSKLVQQGKPLDSDTRLLLEIELVHRFVASPEAKALSGIECCHFMMDAADSQFGATIATLSAAQLGEIVFHTIPEKVRVLASAAAWIIEDLRAFYSYLKREFRLEQADACLGVLGGAAPQKLSAALSDPSKFCLAKSLLTAGREAGFDIETDAGAEAWIRVLDARLLTGEAPASLLGAPATRSAKAPATRSAKAPAARAKKTPRKAVREASKSHKWEFKARFRHQAFGWKPQPAITRIKQAVSEIKKVAKKEPVLAGEGAVVFLERVSPALEQVDSSSGSIGTAVGNAIAELVPLIANAPADPKTRQAWLERLFEAHHDDEIPYIERLGDHWGELCASKELACTWADRLVGATRLSLSRDRAVHAHFHGTCACFSALFHTERSDELCDLLQAAMIWPHKVWTVRALAAKGQKAEALRYAESCRGPWASDDEIDAICEQILLSSGPINEACTR